MGKNVFQVPEGRDQRLRVSQPPHHVQGHGNDGAKQLLQAEGRAQRQPHTEGEANPPSQSDGRTESPPKYRPKLVEVQRFSKTAPGVAKTPEREWRAQRMLSFSFSFLFTLLGFVPPPLCVSLSTCMHFYFDLYVLFYQLVCASLSTCTYLALISLWSF